MATMATPPLPPEVVAQQMPPYMQFMAGGGPQAQPQSASGQFDPLQYVQSVLGQVAAQLKEVADVLVVEKPSIMPILQRMIQAGSALMNEVQGPGEGVPGQAQLPSPQDTAGMVSMS